MRRSITITLTMLLAVGMLAGFAGPVAAQDVSNSADAEVDQDQTNVQASEQKATIMGDNNEVNQSNTQVSEQTQEGQADATAEQGISVDINVNAEFGDEPEEEVTG